MLNVGRIEVRPPVSKMTGFALSYFVLTPGPDIVFPTDPLRKDPDVETARYEILIFHACVIQSFKDLSQVTYCSNIFFFRCV